MTSAHSTLLRSLRHFGAAVALAALVLVPALHAPHLGLRSGAAPEIAVGSIDDAPTCSLCVFVGQARCATASSAIEVAPALSLVVVRARIAPERPALAIFLAATAPRAPPV